MKWTIKNIFDEVMFEVEAETFAKAVEQRSANLQSANLQSANLRFADLRFADLRFANLQYADLQYADLQYADLQSADLRFADLRFADLQFADLQFADLQSADLKSANLRFADLRTANLRTANLRFANLQSADLQSAKGINKYLTSNLYMLLDQPGKIRAYKLVNAQNEGPYNGGIVYEKGKIVSVDNPELNEQIQCGAGINVADLSWCIKEWREGYKILIVEFTAKDIACIPMDSDGKFRLYRCKVVGEKDLKELGLGGVK